MAEKFFWADAIADKVVKEKGEKDFYVCASGITPSGQVHIGNFREVITTFMVVKALRDKGKKVRFIYSWDDFDRFRKVPKGVSEEYEKYIGTPISDIPSPFDSNMTYAEFNEKKFENSLKNMGIETEYLYQNKKNRACAYAESIKKTLDNREKIMNILNKYRKEDLEADWMPIMIYCSKCNKDTTKITSIDGYSITYKCDCGHEETFDYRKKGLISIRWRIDWPLRWNYEGVDFEPGGIDHSVQGGSYTTAQEISREVFGFEPPVYQFYEWISIKHGGEFSSSSGNAMSLDEVSEIYEPDVLRYLFTGTKPKSKFQISLDNDVIKNYEDFDRLEEKYYADEANPQEKRMYEMSVLSPGKEKPIRKGFRHLSTLIQLGKTDDFTEADKVRAIRVKNWLEKYAEDDMKFSLQESITITNDKQKNILLALRELLKAQKFETSKDLFNEFYKMCENLGISNTEFFDICYGALIAKKKGPRLAEFILMIGQDKVISLLDTIE